jgi:hypothetical protein
LKDLWAALLAAAMDPSRTGLVRQSLIAAVKKLDPLDTAVMTRVNAMTEGQLESINRQVNRNELPQRMACDHDEIQVSVVARELYSNS